jgi:hypothetical protein
MRFQGIDEVGDQVKVVSNKQYGFILTGLGFVLVQEQTLGFQGKDDGMPSGEGF